MGTVIPVQNLSTVVVKELFRDRIQAYADEGTNPLVDPKKTKRPEGTTFVLTAAPEREVYYPHIIVKEVARPGGPMDHQVAQQEREYSVRVIIEAKSNKEIYQIRDGLEAWFMDDYMYLNEHGFIDPMVTSNVEANYDDTPQVKRWEIVYTGKVYIARI